MTTFNYVQVAPNSIGLKIDTAEVVSSAGGNPTVERQIVSLGDPTTYGNVAAIKAASTAPSSLDPALVVALSPNSANLPVVVGTALPTGTNVIGEAAQMIRRARLHGGVRSSKRNNHAVTGAQEQHRRQPEASGPRKGNYQSAKTKQAAEE